MEKDTSTDNKLARAIESVNVEYLQSWYYKIPNNWGLTKKYMERISEYLQSKILNSVER